MPKKTLEKVERDKKPTPTQNRTINRVCFMVLVKRLVKISRSHPTLFIFFYKQVLKD